MIRKTISALLTLSSFAIFSQTIVICEVAKDNTMYSENDNSNGQGPTLKAGRTNGKDGTENRRALIQFDLSSIPEGVTIESITLKLYPNNLKPEVGDYDLHVLSDSWGEGTSSSATTSPGKGTGKGVEATITDATWNHRFYDTDNWITAGGDFENTPSVSFTVVQSDVNNQLSISSTQLTDDVKDWYLGTNDNNGWIIIGHEQNNGTTCSFGSSQAPNSLEHPVLEVVYEGANPTAISTPNKTIGLTLLPNPSEGILAIKTDLSINTIEVFSLSGVRVISETLNGTEFTLSQSLDSGIYLVKVIANDGSTYTERLVVN